MYADLEHVKILIAFLKKYKIRNLVLSPGTRNVAFVHSVEKDNFFHCYSIVDERSAGFFGIGLIQELQEPVAICCTSGTAVCNYSSAVMEAYYQKLPLLVLTADRNPYYLNQFEDQMIPQQGIFSKSCKTEISLPFIRNREDVWYCGRILNEALLELNHRGKGPVHINFPIPDGHMDYVSEELPKVHAIERFTADEDEGLKKCFGKLGQNKKILVIYGQDAPGQEKKALLVKQFAEKYNAVFAVDHLSNLMTEGCVSTFMITKTLTADVQKELMPDIVISLNGNFVSGIRALMHKAGQEVRHWLVCESGEIADPFRKLQFVFEMSAQRFLEKAIEYAPEGKAKADYRMAWEEREKKLIYPETEYCDFYTVRQFMDRIPGNSLLHLANSSSVRLAQYFKLDSTVRVYCNRGTNGIDGSMSAFIAQSYVAKCKSFLLIGDLSFFYDMNAFWNRYINSNMRILLNNNEGAEIFHYTHGKEKIDTIDDYMAVAHHTSAKGWALERGFLYLEAHDKASYEKALEIFFGDSDKPVLLEAFTDKEKDAKILKEIEYQNGAFAQSGTPGLLDGIKKNVKDKIKERIKSSLYEG